MGRKNGKKRRRRRRVLCLLAAAAFLLAAAAGLLWFNLSGPQLRRRALAALKRALAPGCRLDVRSVKLRSLRVLELEDLWVCAPEHQGREKCVAVRKVRAKVSLSGLLSGRVAFRSITISGATFHLQYRKGVGWNLKELLRKPEKPRAPAISLPEALRFEQCKLLVDPKGLAEEFSIARLEHTDAEDFSFKFEGTLGRQGEILNLQAEAVNALLGRVRISGDWFPKEGRFDVVFEVPELVVGQALLERFPGRIRDIARKHAASGTADLRVDVSFRRGEAVKVQAGGLIKNGRADLSFIPYPLRDLRCRFSFNGQVLELGKVTCRIGAGRLEGGGAFTFRGGKIEGAKGRFSVEGLVVDERIASAAPEKIKEIWKDFRITGPFGVEGDFVLKGGALHVEGAVALLGVQVVPAQFPYPVSALKGRLRFNGKLVTTDGPVVGRSGPAKLELQGKFEPKARGMIDMSIKVEDLPLDEKLRSALDPEVRAVWDELQVGGRAGGLVALKRRPGDRLVEIEITMQPDGARLCYEAFPYAVEGITGKLFIKRGEVRIEKLKGRHGSAEVICRGGLWRKEGAGSIFGFVFASPDLPLDRDLTAAIGPEGRRIIEDFGFEGRIRPEVKVYRRKPEDKAAVQIDAEVLKGSCRHRSFPYRLALHGGRILVSDGSVRVENLQGSHGTLSLKCKRAVVNRRGDTWEYDLELSASGLNAQDSELLAALPGHIRQFLGGLSVKGIYDVPSLTVFYRRSGSDPTRYELTYEAEVTTTNGFMDMGMKFREISGRARVMGKAATDYPHKATGKLQLASVRFNRLQLTNVVLSCTYGRRHELLARFAKSGPAPGLPPLTYNAFLSRYPDDKSARDSFQVWIESAEAYRGRVTGFLAVDLGARRELVGQVFVKDVDLAEASKDLFKSGEAEGRAEATALFYGPLGDLRNLKGSGEAKVRQANLVRLPLFVSIFNLLRLKPVGNSYFHRVDVTFVFDRGRFKAPTSRSITLQSDLLTLRGGGSMDFELNLDLYLSLPSFGLPHIPVVSDVLKRLIDNVAVFHVSGSVDDPKVRIVPMKDVLSLFRSGD